MDLYRASPTRTPAYFLVTTFHTGYYYQCEGLLNCNAVYIVLATALGFLRLMALTISVVSKMLDLVMPVKDGNGDPPSDG
jgi:hypothetical protein